MADRPYRWIPFSLLPLSLSLSLSCTSLGPPWKRKEREGAVTSLTFDFAPQLPSLPSWCRGRVVPARTLLTLRDPFLPPFLGPCCLQGWTAPPRDISLRNPPFSSPRKQQHGQPRTNERTERYGFERGWTRQGEKIKSKRGGEGVLQGRGEWEFEKGKG